MSLSAIRAGLKTRLETISGLYVHSYFPANIAQTPAAIINPGGPASFNLGGQYHATMGSIGDTEHVFTVNLLVSISKGLLAAETELDLFIDANSSSSIHAAIEGGVSLGGAAQTSQVVSYRDYGLKEIGGQQYLGVDFEIHVWEGP